MRRGRWPRRLPEVLAWVLWALTLLELVATLWLDRMLRAAGRADLALRVYEWPYAAMVVTAATVGVVVALRRPRHPVGWLLLAFGLAVMQDGLTDTYARYGLLASPGAVPAVELVRVLGDTFILWPAILGFILLLTPTGSPPSPRWRRWALVAAAAPLARQLTVLGVPEVRYEFYSVRNPLYVPALEAPLGVIAYPLTVITLLSVVVGGLSLVLRFRRARGVERQQLRWVASAAALVVVVVPLAVVGIAVTSPTLVGVSLLGYAVILCLAIGAAVLRYRLYDLDRIISRTIAYALLSVLLGLAYATVVLGLGHFLGRDRSSLAVAGATLAVAAAFQPARRRVQTLVDRRFNRHRYDAARTIEAFTARLRQQIDLDALTAELLAVVDQTVQPTRAALWLRRRTAAGDGSPAARGSRRGERLAAGPSAGGHR